MWGDPDTDPGGGTPGPGPSRENKDLKEHNEQQQVLIAQLKEMLRKEQSTVPQEKVEEYVNTLSKAKAKKSRSKRDDSGSTEKSTSMDSKKHEKVNLMKQQLEENKAKLAERGMRQKDIEDMVSMLKVQLNDSSLQLMSSVSASLPNLEKNLEYNKNTSPEELYNILLVKEKKIMDLLEKGQKQEATILDLQENLKEKDSVLDARTKAITLMTENLSKKSKDTLDTLDETKEQMRKMQENFITLESEMKARQMVLLNDLKSKNIEIADLQEKNNKLLEDINKLRNHNDKDENESDNYELLLRDLNSKLADSKNVVKENQATIELLRTEINELKEKLLSKHQDQNESDGITKLKKQLDESNKNMIKVKAQHKSKIKDLNKKLDGFKKMSDANATIIQLQNENTKLNEKIAELEEEKGNMQLKMVESIESTKGSINSDDFRELHEKFERNLDESEAKDKVINLLESDIISLKTELKDLNDKMSGFSQLKNEKVTSEMQSIQIEEQLEILESSNKELHNEIEILRREKAELLEKIEEFIKEKMELTTKLDNYIQENMELIDKLEKLSAEKVSSAESIEIVEGLTQQEKLELAAYQKNIDPNIEDSVKAQEEEPPAELNESVLQLTEETAELLKKIEMFNMERKEVMIKLEALREENNQLSLKLNEVENNREVLAETYEQVQTEKDELVKENETLIRKLRELENQQYPQETNEDKDKEVFLKLEYLQKEYERVLEENNNLKKCIKELNEVIQEKDHLETELRSCKEKSEGLELKVKENIDEINNYRSIIEENKSELINSSNIINQLQTELGERDNNINELNSFINDLNNVVADLQEANLKLNNFEDMEYQLNQIKTALNEQVESAEKQVQEFREELDFNKTLYENELEKKNREIDQLTQEIAFKEEMIITLKQQLKDKDQSVKSTIEKMKEKYIGLQAQLNANSESLKKQVEDLAAKNKEQLEKMKKIAANLKKKTQTYQELEEKYNAEKEKWETEINKKETGSQDIESLKLEISMKGTLLGQSEARIHELSYIVSNLEQQNVDLQNMLLEARQRQEKSPELSLKQELSSSLHEEFDNVHGSKESINEDKIKEMQLIIETHEVELHHYKERSQMLEEDLAILLEEKDRLLVKSREMEAKLSLLSKSVEEKSLMEEKMDHKLQEVAANDEVLAKQVEELTKENKELLVKTRDQEEVTTKLKIKIKKLQDKISQMKNMQTCLEEQEQANTELKRQIVQLEALQKQMQQEYEEKLNQHQKDYDGIESDYQLQLEGLVKSRNELTFECERLQEEVKGLKEREEELLMELTGNNQKLSDVENKYNNEIAVLTGNLNQTTSNWQSSVEKIETLQMEVNSLQSQMLSNAAKETVEEVLSDAKSKVNTQLSVTIHNYSFQGESPPQDPDVSVTKEDLENKIKALEILLYNVDQEKEEVIQECSDMLNELTRLVYEKVGNNALSTVPTVASLQPLSDVESQILSFEEIDAQNDRQTLQKLEFETTDPSLGQQNVPVEENVGHPSIAYLTYQPNQPLNEEESDFGLERHPVVESFAQISKAHLMGEAVGENDDGWGWGPEEARLEEEHQYKAENTPQIQALKVEVDKLKEKIQILQTERETHLEEIKQLQIKSSKLVKKCNEFKLKNDELIAKTKSDTDNFFDLDQTIQEELKTQIERLETKIKEITLELDKEKLEKLNTVKKLEVVTASNEKMIQMSQIQDSEIYRWKRKYEQVEEKLNWGSEESKSPIETPKEYTEDVEELRKLVQDLTVDNEELQALLNDQKQQRVQLERSSKSIDNDERIKNLEEDILSKEALINKLNEENEQFKIMHNQNTNVIIECSEKQSTNLLDELDKKNTVIQELEKSLKNLTSSLREKENQLENNNHKLEDIESLLVTKTARIEQLQNSNDSLVEEISTLRHEIECLKQDFANAEANTSENHPNQFQYQHQQPVDDIHPLIQELTDFKANTIRELVELVNNFDQIIAEKIKDLTEELSSQKQRYRDLQSVSSKNILELQLALEDQKQLEVENNEKLKEAIDQLEKAKRKLVDIELDNEQINNYSERIRELEAELSNLQSLSAKNILELQIALEEQKRKNDQLEVENVDKIKELEKKYTELEFVLQLTQGKSDNDKEVQINELNVMIKNLQDNNNELEGSIKELKDRLNAKEQELDRTVSEMENKLVETVTEVEEKWAAQVDERGNTVAESWKYHLSIVESDFAAIQEKLKNEINELEEKCNALVNENNELRRNVDTEIKQEVDRISALQQQINDRQRAINELKQLLTTEQLEKAAMAQQISEIDKIHQLLADKEVELASLKILAEATRQQFDEKRQVVEEIVKLLEQNTAFPLSCENKDILNELRRQLILSCDKNQKVDNLHSQLQNANIQIQTYSIAIQEREAEISRLNEVYEKQFNEITELNKIVEQLKEQAMQITEKDENIRTLQSTIEEYDIRLSANQQEIQNLQQQCSQLNYSSEEGRQAHDSLQNVIAQKEQEIGHLNQEIQNLNVQIINLTHQLETFKENKETSLHNVISQQENEISNLNQQMHNLKLEISNLNQQLLFLTDNKESEKLEAELAQHKEEYLVVQQSLRDCQQQLFDITQDLATKSHEHDTVSQQLAYVQQHSDLLQDEINKLKETLHIKEQEYFVSIENIQKTNYKELESHYEEILSAKDLDIQTLRTQVAESVYNANENLTIRNELEESNKQLQARVDELVGVKSDLEMNILQQTSLTKEENKQLDEMRSIIEEQVVKIEELKKELFEKSNDYDSIIAEMDISRNAITQQPTLSSSRTENPSAATEERPAVPEYDLSEPVNRAELDLALYMLHQRDVRCEELTVELTQLLEERDTLQLRLSNAIREKEELRRNVKEITNSPEVPLSSSASNDVLLGTSKTSRSSEIFLAASGTELATEPSEKLGVDQDLAKKLSELKTVGYKKDKTFVDEQEKRRFQQISIMQQHIKEASKLPPEAAAKLVDASYTLSRDVQSPSKVLLNWLWGRSTPRVNDT